MTTSADLPYRHLSPEARAPPALRPGCRVGPTLLSLPYSGQHRAPRIIRRHYRVAARPTTAWHTYPTPTNARRGDRAPTLYRLPCTALAARLPCRPPRPAPAQGGTRPTKTESADLPYTSPRAATRDRGRHREIPPRGPSSPLSSSEPTRAEARRSV